ncbi:hypothetical protein GETHLI_28110 [Geothrix limicola]|uniref:Uncharacterized protein n=1 Tax=Geothrix limicola TaxID=2927978 RepID=A0ABQ5QJW1_9BACT|nr:hypothetical protein [Geothrix limicola]GLH74309.1 hypothetical protein GETHLI_28110 [Geothrix limicola]
MNVNAMGALSAYTYQSALTQTGSTNQALSQALAASQAQVNDLNSLFSSDGAIDPLASLSGASALQDMSTLTYSAAAASGNGSTALQALVNAQGSNLGSLFSSSDSLSVSEAVLSPSTAEALARYAYDQSQNQTASTAQTSAQTAAQAVASGQQALFNSSLDLLG